MSRPKIVVTGASGGHHSLLGRAVVQVLKEKAGQFEVIGTAFSRATETLLKLDLTDYVAIDAFMDLHKPVAVIHCAAERRPDVAERDRDGVRRLNVESTKRIALAAKRNASWFLYISTDYVFDGTSPPYEVDAKPNPLNFYGETKHDGELATKEVYPEAAILRVPVLYGDVTDPTESAVNILIPLVQDSSKKVVMDDFQSRFPTNVVDVGKIIRALIERVISGRKISGVFHFSASEQMTKYGMCAIFAEILGVSIAHIEAQRDPPKDSLANRPVNAQLSTRRLHEEEGINVLDHASFKGWFMKYLKK
ncbi:hypothetical protein HDU97_008856 [Phlyctochytrium planicorne]|nr:hypothetical protein HDU97_008856 [Phlyctochytrium planicorne]